MKKIRKFVSFSLAVRYTSGLTQHQKVEQEIDYNLSDKYIQKTLVFVLASDAIAKEKNVESYTIYGISIRRLYEEQYKITL